MIQNLETRKQDEEHDPSGFWRAAGQQIAELPIPANRNCPQIGAKFSIVYASYNKVEGNCIQEGASEDDKRYLRNFFARCYEIFLTRRLIAEIADMPEFELETVTFMGIFLENSVIQRIPLYGCIKEDTDYSTMRENLHALLSDFWNLPGEHNSKIAEWSRVREACRKMKKITRPPFSPRITCSSMIQRAALFSLHHPYPLEQSPPFTGDGLA